VDHSQRGALSAHVPQDQRQQPLDVQAIRLGVARGDSPRYSRSR
jgi:hypothetical protein